MRSASLSFSFVKAAGRKMAFCSLKRVSGYFGFIFVLFTVEEWKLVFVATIQSSICQLLGTDQSDLGYDQSSIAFSLPGQKHFTFKHSWSFMPNKCTDMLLSDTVQSKFKQKYGAIFVTFLTFYFILNIAVCRVSFPRTAHRLFIKK